jgi:hypothetical protein
MRARWSVAVLVVGAVGGFGGGYAANALHAQSAHIAVVRRVAGTTVCTSTRPGPESDCAATTDPRNLAGIERGDCIEMTPNLVVSPWKIERVDASRCRQHGLSASVQ